MPDYKKVQEVQAKLLEKSKGLDFSTQEQLRAIEDRLAEKYFVSTFDISQKNDPLVSKFLALTSLPFFFYDTETSPFGLGMEHYYEQCQRTLKQLWKLDWPHEETIGELIRRPTMPTGSMTPTYMFIGDAPGVADGAIFDHFDRVLVYGPSSHLLRRALIKNKIYTSSWFTNLLKLSTPKNRPATKEEVLSQQYLLAKEIELLQPEKLILLGKNVEKLFPLCTALPKTIPTVHLFHPSYYVHKHLSSAEYAEAIKNVIGL